MAGSKRGQNGGTPAMSIVDDKQAENGHLAVHFEKRTRVVHGLNGVRTHIVEDERGGEL